MWSCSCSLRFDLILTILIEISYTSPGRAPLNLLG